MTAPSAASLGTTDRYLLRGYEWVWGATIPLLRRHPRLATGYAQRCLRDANAPLPRADLWCQAASAGEAYLAIALSTALDLRRPTRLLVTTQTRQGYDILKAEADRRQGGALEMVVRYLPFDRPSLMQTAVDRVRPRLTVLLETELWPGFMGALKAAGLPLMVINARMGARSQHHYLLRPSLWRALRPETIMALSHTDAGRFASVFGPAGVTTMANIKFDRVNADLALPSAEMETLFSSDRPLVVLGSVRSAEETLMEALLARLHQHHPQARLALFPRHMERLDHWRRALSRRALPWVLRSRASADHPVVKDGGVLLWDRFGELGAAYALACGAYVGGSLVPLGGQNFLEPLAQGIRPVIGPHWDNFAWVGREVVSRGLVHEAKNADGVFQKLSTAIEGPATGPDKAGVRAALETYLAPRRGGSAQAAARIRAYLA
jgi:3-deoxy-D-manno-octulosonic-acid transferase